MKRLLLAGFLLAAGLFVAHRWQAHKLDIDERALDRLVFRPSISWSKSRTQLRAVSLLYMGGYASKSPCYQVRFTNDDRFTYEGWRDMPVLGLRQGRFLFADLAAWLDAQPVSIAGRIGLGSAMHSPTFEIQIERLQGPNTTIMGGGDPIEDPEVWELLRVLQGLALSALSESSRGPA